jgi:hypothetical protein
MRERRTLSLITSAVLVAVLSLAAGNASGATAHRASTMLKYYFKATGTSFTTPSGKPTSTPAKGDILFATDDMYKGTKAHHASNWTATAFLYCTVTKATQSSLEGRCDGVIAIAGSMLISQSTQNLGASSAVYPITAGTGKYLHAKGSVKTTNLNKSGSEANGVITIK